MSISYYLYELVAFDKKPYIGNFLRKFYFCWALDLPEIAKNNHSEK